jgi:Pyridoxamine 5'-phosphate oxidase
MHWTEFEFAAPRLARFARERFEKDQVLLLGTIRRDGSPRISPVEPDFANGRLYLGMIWQSYKALDLLRDPRCSAHGLIRDRMATGGEIKLHGRAVEILEPDERTLYRQAIYRRINWMPEEPRFHLFAFEVISAGRFIYEEDARIVIRWREGAAERKYRDYMDGRIEEIE